MRARGSEFVDFLDAVRAQAEVTWLGRWARAARRVCLLPWGAALLAGCFSFARQSDENQEGKEAEEEAKHEPRAATVSLLIRQVVAEDPEDYPENEIPHQQQREFHDDSPTLLAFVALPFYHSGGTLDAAGAWVDNLVAADIR